MNSCGAERPQEAAEQLKSGLLDALALRKGGQAAAQEMIIGTRRGTDD